MLALSHLVNIDELVENKLILEELFAALDELDPENRRIAELYSMGKTEHEIANVTIHTF